MVRGKTFNQIKQEYKKAIEEAKKAEADVDNAQSLLTAAQTRRDATHRHVQSMRIDLHSAAEAEAMK